MATEKSLEITVGLFLLAGIVALMLLAFKVSGLTFSLGSRYYTVTASFANIGNLKPRAAVRIAGVKIGEVEAIRLNPDNYMADVVLEIDDSADKIPVDSNASILTAGLLGENYVSFTPGFEDTFLKENDHITNTSQAMILENLIGQLVFNMNKKDKQE